MQMRRNSSLFMWTSFCVQFLLQIRVGAFYSKLQFVIYYSDFVDDCYNYAPIPIRQRTGVRIAAQDERPNIGEPKCRCDNANHRYDLQSFY